MVIFQLGDMFLRVRKVIDSPLPLMSKQSEYTLSETLIAWYACFLYTL